ncbi:unnamed protein product [Dovyalis caffra]|uniref:Uncharacterized protein n=1 Tax=Dovyalis caffra TaxID=77055 RepID=A0AAV1RJD9_9ROSI|nr:unnamed protein product [Dovyalis caffra]
MAVKFTVTVAVLFFLCTVAFSRTPLGLPYDDVALSEITKSDPKATPALLLPSQNPESESKPETEPITVVTYPVNEEIADKTEQEGSTTEVKTESVETVVPLTVVTFRPINPQFFPRRPLLPLRPRHRCRHWHKIMKPRFYGNDMIVSGEKNHGFGVGDEATRGAVRQIPVKRARFHHGGPRFSFFDELANGEEREWGHKKHHKNRRVEGEEKEKEEKHEHKHEHKWGLLRRIRKAEIKQKYIVKTREWFFQGKNMEPIAKMLIDLKAFWIIN